MPKKKLKEGDKVAHMSNLSLPGYVERIIFKRILLTSRDESGQPVKTKDDKFEKKPHSRLIGIEVSFKDLDSGKILKEVFHSNNLVPWEIVEKGEKAVQQYRENNVNLK